MKLEGKSEVLIEIVEEYMKQLYDKEKDNNDSRERIFIDDGIMNATGLKSRNYLMFKSLVCSNLEIPNLYSIDIEIDPSLVNDFISLEYKKVIQLINKTNKSNTTITSEFMVNLALIILNDTAKFYNTHISSKDVLPELSEPIRNHFS